MKNIKERVKEAMKEWDNDRLRSELSVFIDHASDDELKQLFFDDIATEEDYESFRKERN